jgi:alkylation response protein AidB-like acyl-CoA dehydrogenase
MRAMDASTATADIYDLPAEHKDFRDTIRQIVTDKVAPRAAEIDASGEYPWDIRMLPALQATLADMQTKTAAGRKLPYKACAMADRNEKDLGMFSSMAMLFASDAPRDVTIEPSRSSAATATQRVPSRADGAQRQG